MKEAKKHSEEPPSATSQKVSKPARTRRRTLVRASIVIIIIASLLAGAYLIISPDNKPPVSSQTKTVDPGEKIILPSSKSIDDLGGWRRVSPPENEPVFAYIDEINDVQISVSQQQLPKTFKNNPKEKVEELARSYNATAKIEAGNVVAYIGTSAKGPQSVIFVKNDLLVLMKSVAKVDDLDWAEYIKMLDSPDLKNVPKY